MTPLAIVFMAFSWAFVLGLTAWSFRRVLRANGRRGTTPPEVPEDTG